MKLFITLALLLQSYTAMAMGPDPTVQNAKPGACYYAGSFFLRIVGKIDETHYNVVSAIGMGIEYPGILETTKSEFSGKGRLAETAVTYLGDKELPNQEGFKTNFHLWRECK